MGAPPPTMALVPIAPASAQRRCIEPPRPREQPVLFPNISAMMAFMPTPRSSAWPCSR